MPVIAIANQKGGVAKTATAFNLAHALVRRQKSILMVDLDPQGSLTDYAGYEPASLDLTIYPVLHKKIPARRAIIPHPQGPDLIPANIDLAAIELELAGALEREFKLADALEAKGLPAKPGSAWGLLIDRGLLDAVEPTLIQPTFITDYPRDISPLAKAKPDDPTHVERFEYFVGGLEMGNAFTELNDLFDQEQRFSEAGRLYAPEDDEAHPMDEDYSRAMKYGMPPNGGFGLGVDQLVMLLTDSPTIREVILFPQLRAKE